MGRKSRVKAERKKGGQAQRSAHIKPNEELPDAKPKFPKTAFSCTLLLISTAYLCTMWPSISGGDSGELAVVAQTLGIAHPPGYPLFTLLGHIFTYLPFGTIARRVALLSVLCSTGAAALIFASVFTLSRNKAAALLSSLMFASAPLIWRYSIQVEVFALNNFFTALAVYVFIRCQSEEAHRWLYLLSFTLGLGLCNHHTLLIAVFPLFLCALWRHRRHFASIKAALELIFWGVLGLLPYLYVPIRALGRPQIAWGDQSSLSGFISHLARSDYGTLRLGGSASHDADLIRGLELFFQELSINASYNRSASYNYWLLSASQLSACKKRCHFCSNTLCLSRFFSLACQLFLHQHLYRYYKPILADAPCLLLYYCRARL